MPFVKQITGGIIDLRAEGHEPVKMKPNMWYHLTQKQVDVLAEEIAYYPGGRLEVISEENIALALNMEEWEAQRNALRAVLRSGWNLLTSKGVD